MCPAPAAISFDRWQLDGSKPPRGRRNAGSANQRPRGGTLLGDEIRHKLASGSRVRRHRGSSNVGRRSLAFKPFWPIPRASPGSSSLTTKSGVPAERRGLRPRARHAGLRSRCPRPRRGSASLRTRSRRPSASWSWTRSRGPAHVRRCGREDRRPRPSGAIAAPPPDGEP